MTYFRARTTQNTHTYTVDDGTGGKSFTIDAFTEICDYEKAFTAAAASLRGNYGSVSMKGPSPHTGNFNFKLLRNCHFLWIDDAGEMYAIKNASGVDITFTFNGETFVLPAQNYIISDFFSRS